MSDPNTPNRFKAEMPEIPGVSGPGTKHSPGGAMAIRLVGGLLAVLVGLVIGTRFVMRSKHAEPQPVQPTPQIEIPTPAADPAAGRPKATEGSPGIATGSEMAKPWVWEGVFFQPRL